MYLRRSDDHILACGDSINLISEEGNYIFCASFQDGVLELSTEIGKAYDFLIVSKEEILYLIEQLNRLADMLQD